MGYGLITTGYNNFVLISSEEKSLTFGNKAYRKAGDYYIQDLAGGYKVFNNTDYNSSGSHTTGVYQLYCRGEVNGCAAHSANVTLPDETGFWTYQVDNLDSYPTIFINTTNINTAATVIGVKRIGTTKSYEFKVLVSFSSGRRSSAEAEVNIYCFHAKATSSSSGFGLNMYNSAGEPTFNVNDKLLVIGDILTVTAIGGTKEAPTETSSFLASPPTAATSMSKPAFLSMDWARPSHEALNSYSVGQWDSYDGECDGSNSYRTKFVQKFIGSSFNVKSDGTARLHISGTHIDSFQCGIGGGASASNMTWNIGQLPMYVPITDGAKYD